MFVAYKLKLERKNSFGQNVNLIKRLSHARIVPHWQYCIENFCKDGHILWDDDNFTSVGGESYADMRARCREFMSFVEKLSCEKIVVFSHAGFMLTLVDEIMKRESKIGRNIECDNGCVCVLKCNDGVWKIKRWNIKKSDAIKKDSVVY